jgi:hypothetical protein
MADRQDLAPSQRVQEDVVGGTAKIRTQTGARPQGWRAPEQEHDGSADRVGPVIRWNSPHAITDDE